jgi:chromosome segregation ATPase
MALDNSQSQDVDLDRTDKLPILEDVVFDHDVFDDAVRLDHTAVLPGAAVAASQGAQSEFARPPGVDLPSLAETVRSVEERIARQNAEYEALGRLYEKARDAESAAMTRANALAADLAAALASLAVEQHRSRELDRTLAERSIAADATRTRVEEALRESERYQSESRTLRDSLATRDATIAQVLHSLGERDAQLHALQREHAQTVPALEARSQASAKLEAELKTARSRTEAIAVELNSAQQSVTALTTQVKRSESELIAVRQDLSNVKRQADSYLETLRTREWRRGFDQNLLREWDQKMDAARAGHGALQAERDRLEQTAAAFSRKLVEQDAMIAKLQSAVATDAAALGKKAQELEEGRRAHAKLAARIDELEGEHKRLRSELAARDQALAEARALGSGETQRVKELLAAAEQRHAEQVAQMAGLQAEAETHEQEMTVLMAHLNEARRPIQSIQADVKRLSEELAIKTASLEQLNEDNLSLRSALERTRGALEEREFLIRRLERSESNNANVLGRIQTSIERLGTAPAPTAGPVLAAECSAELHRIDGGHNTVYTLARRTRIGRAAGCELQIDSNSVSRHHALLLKGPRDLIIEDLNSTNGVVVNGRKISRQLLSDGDLLTIGDVQFRCSVKPAQRQSAAPPDAVPAGPRPAEPRQTEPGPAG